MKKRNFAVIPGVVVLISIAFVNCGDDGGTTPSGPTSTGYAHFMPLHKGNQWVYEYLYSSSGGSRETDEYELLVVDEFKDYHGLESYLVRCKWAYEIPSVKYITLGYDGDRCFVFTCPWWEFLIEDDMAWKTWSQTGLFTSYMLEFNLVRDISVPAGEFKDCKQLGLMYQEGSYTYIYEECYAKDVGLVYYRSRRESGSSWSMYEYKLKSCKVAPHE
jgi:hypothetical protein